jgi:hypothetical protein
VTSSGGGLRLHVGWATEKFECMGDFWGEHKRWVEVGRRMGYREIQIYWDFWGEHKRCVEGGRRMGYRDIQIYWDFMSTSSRAGDRAAVHGAMNAPHASHRAGACSTDTQASERIQITQNSPSIEQAHLRNFYCQMFRMRSAAQQEL